MALGDRLLLARILLKALDAKELDEEQCERLFGLNGPGTTWPAAHLPDQWVSGVDPPAPTLEPDIQADLSRSLAAVDAKEQREMTQERQDIEHADQALALAPLEPTEGKNLLEDPADFVAKVRTRRRQMGRG